MNFLGVINDLGWEKSMKWVDSNYGQKKWAETPELTRVSACKEETKQHSNRPDLVFPAVLRFVPHSSLTLFQRLFAKQIRGFASL